MTKNEIIPVLFFIFLTFGFIYLFIYLYIYIYMCVCVCVSKSYKHHAVQGLPFPGFPTVVDRYGRAAWARDRPDLTPHLKHMKKADNVPSPVFETCTTLKVLDRASYPIGLCKLQPGLFKMYE
jgi:hypothetical protein